LPPGLLVPERETAVKKKPGARSQKGTASSLLAPGSWLLASGFFPRLLI
jgi:hypothetical protein